MAWPLSILVAVLCLTGHMIAIKFLGDKFPSSFVTPAFYSCAVLLLWVIYLIDRPTIEGGLQSIFSPTILVTIALAGFTIGLTDFFFVRSINQGADITVAMPLLLAGSICLLTILGILFFKETLHLWKGLGVVLTVTGLFLIFKK